MNHDHDQTPGTDCPNCEYEFGHAPGCPRGGRTERR